MNEPAKRTSTSTVRFYKCPRSNRMLAEKKLISKTAPQQLLMREGKALQHLSGSIAPTFIELKEEEGELSLIMEKVEGETLSRVLNETTLSSDELANLCRSLIKTINQLHSSGIAHLDLAPNNIILSNQSAYGIVLLDFAYCAFAEELPFMRPRSSFAGHLNYAAPEQLGLGSNMISDKVDLYALGLIIREVFGYQDHVKDNYNDAIEFRRCSSDHSKLPPDWLQMVTQLLKFPPGERVRILTHSDYSTGSSA
ncbi:protein kinase [Pseudovibrio sp. FO-BEG1]|uniref:protein kinase domain-containing protein n=1 Tax=Pseudovibrio sp. (strain FO-BEG1) TaxID=911045 RepID=UPI00210FE37D|nr:protein kinase [Pseudovibrio sp. FO-BEG1]